MDGGIARVCMKNVLIWRSYMGVSDTLIDYATEWFERNDKG